MFTETLFEAGCILLMSLFFLALARACQNSLANEARSLRRNNVGRHASFNDPSLHLVRSRWYRLQALTALVKAGKFALLIHEGDSVSFFIAGGMRLKEWHEMADALHNVAAIEENAKAVTQILDVETTLADLSRRGIILPDCTSNKET